MKRLKVPSPLGNIGDIPHKLTIAGYTILLSVNRRTLGRCSLRHINRDVRSAGRPPSIVAAMLTLSMGAVGCKSRSFDNQSQQKTAMFTNVQGNLTGYYFVVRVDKRKRWNHKNDSVLNEPAVCIYGNDFKLNPAERERYKNPKELVEDKGSKLTALSKRAAPSSIP
jgi:hypothetical protein